MRALVYERFGGPVQVRDVPDPEPSERGVVVRVEATGLCRSDWHGWAGHDPDIRLPHVPGHELAGTVEAVGAGVHRWSVGDRVTVPFVCGCGRCEWCTSGQAQVCPDQTQPGFTGWGSFARYVALHEADTNLVAIPGDVSSAAAAALGCRFATAYRALVGRARVRPGEWVAVIGCGGVGLSATLVAVALGARVVAVDREPGALAMAAELGAELTVADDMAGAVPDLTGGGAHVAIDAVGSEQTAADSILSLRRRGRHVQVGLLPSVVGLPRLPMERVIGWELDLLGSHGMAAADYPGMLGLVASGVLRPDRLVTGTVGLAEAAARLPQLDRAGPAGITVLDPHRD